MAEFALIASLLFLMLFGVIQLGLVMAAQNGLVNGVRDSARRAATYRVNDQTFAGGATFAAVCANIESELVYRLSHEIPAFASARLTDTIRYQWVQNPDGADYALIAQVDATYSNPIWIPLVGNVIHPSDPANLPLSASEQMRVENPALTPADTTQHTCP
jgi:Flp pilus assembly protein TadG